MERIVARIRLVQDHRVLQAVEGLLQEQELPEESQLVPLMALGLMLN